MALWASGLLPSAAARARRTPSRSSHLSCASSVEQVPSVMESPKAITDPVEDDPATSIALSHHVEVVVPVKRVASSTCDRSPDPSGATYDVTCAPECWLGRAFASGTYTVTA